LCFQRNIGRSSPRRTRCGDATRSGNVHQMKDRPLDWLIDADENDQIAPRWLI
jgi:hypothetical protein